MTIPVRLRGVFDRRDLAINTLVDAGDVAIVTRAGRPRWALIRCPDGCGEDLSVNLDDRAGRAWRLSQHRGVSLYPSVWRDSGCRSHFIVWRGEIWWHVPRGVRTLQRTKRKVLELLSRSHQAVLDTDLVVMFDEDAWEVRMACESLVADGLVTKIETDGLLAFQENAIP